MTVKDLKVGDVLDIAGFKFLRIELPQDMTVPTGKLPFLDIETENGKYATSRLFSDSTLVVRIECISGTSTFVRNLYKMVI